MRIEPFSSLASLQAWASQRHSFPDEGTYDGAALSLELTHVDFLVQVLLSAQTDSKLKPMLAAAIAKHLYRALKHNEVPPRVIDETTVKLVASSLKRAPELQRELPQYVIQAITPYA